MAAPVKPVQSKGMAAHMLGQVTRGHSATVHPPAGGEEGNMPWWQSQAQVLWLMGLHSPLSLSGRSQQLDALS